MANYVKLKFDLFWWSNFYSPVVIFSYKRYTRVDFDICGSLSSTATTSLMDILRATFAWGTITWFLPNFLTAPAQINFFVIKKEKKIKLTNRAQTNCILHWHLKTIRTARSKQAIWIKNVSKVILHTERVLLKGISSIISKLHK